MVVYLHCISSTPSLFGTFVLIQYTSSLGLRVPGVRIQWNIEGRTWDIGVLFKRHYSTVEMDEGLTDVFGDLTRGTEIRENKGKEVILNGCTRSFLRRDSCNKSLSIPGKGGDNERLKDE